jgi:hypothetical protein
MENSNVDRYCEMDGNAARFIEKAVISKVIEYRFQSLLCMLCHDIQEHEFLGISTFR